MTLRWLLAGSVCLNFFLAGVAIPPYLHGPGPGPFGFGHHPHHPPGPVGMLLDLSEHINAADAAIIHKAIAERGLDHPPENGDDSMDVLMGNLRQTIAAPAFDQAAFTAALDKLRAKRRAEGEAVESALQQAVAAMSPQGRKEMADWMEHPPRP